MAQHAVPRPRLLDLFCCTGGAAGGYHQAGFDVVGGDIVKQSNYPFEFLLHDALTLDPDWFQESATPADAYQPERVSTGYVCPGGSEDVWRTD